MGGSSTGVERLQSNQQTLVRILLHQENKKGGTHRRRQVHEVEELLENGDHDHEVVFRKQLPDLSFVFLKNGGLKLG